jgi:hypothetical protein
MIAATTRREILNIVVISMEVDDQSRSQESVHARDSGAALQAQKTPFHFNELNEQINEKKRTSNTPK